MELFEFLVASLAYFIIIIGVAGIAYKSLIHVLPLLAAPTYACILFIELQGSRRRSGGSPRLFKLNRPLGVEQRFWMDTVAAFAFLFAIVVVSLIPFTDDPKVINALITGKLVPPVFIWMFLISFFLTCLISFLSPPDDRHPLTKLRKLGIPKFLKNYFGDDSD